jgi:hypothetical protein
MTFLPAVPQDEECSNQYGLASRQSHLHIPRNLVASMMAKQPWGFTDDLLVLKSTTSISFASIEEIDSWTRAAFTVVLGAWCKPDRVHSKTPCGASTEQALTASMKCSDTTLRVHSPVSVRFLNVSLGRSARPVYPITNTGGS